MMATETPTNILRNGHQVIRLGDTIAERKPFEINKRELQGWVTTNGRYPSSVAAELDDARNAYSAKRVPLIDGPATPPLVEAVRELVDRIGPGGSIPTEEITTRLAVLKQALAQHDATPQFKPIPEVEWSAYVTRVLMILVPGLEEQEADLLGTDTRLAVLMELGYFNPPAGADAPAKDDEQGAPSDSLPPVPAESSTGPSPEPDSPGSTAE